MHIDQSAPIGLNVRVALGHPKPRAPGAPPDVALGDGERAEWSGNGDITQDKPVCTLTIAFPTTALIPPPRWTALARAEGVMAPPLNPFIARTARLTLRFWCSYVVDCKDDCHGLVPVELNGSISALQRIRGPGTARSDVRVVLNIDPFNQVVFAPGPLLGRNYFAAFKAGGPLILPFNDAGLVACGDPQEIEGTVTVEASADFAATALARVDEVTFTIAAPDPPGRAEITLFEPVRVAIEPDRAPAKPRPARRYVLRPLPPPPGARTICGLVAEEGKLVLATIRESGEDTEAVLELLRLDLDTGKYSRPLRVPLDTWGRLLRLADGLYALDLGPRSRDGGTARKNGGKLVRINSRGTSEIVARGLNLPTDAVQIGERLLVSEPTQNCIREVDSRGRRRTLLGGLEFPLALATPAPGSAWQAPLYVSEAGRPTSSAFAPGQGRIRAVDPEKGESSVVLADVSAVALAASPTGTFGTDLVLATANDWSPERESLPNSGRILRLAPSGTLTEVVAAIDEPLDLCFSPSGRCFVLAKGSLFEIAAR